MRKQLLAEMMNSSINKKIVMVGLLSIALFLWALNFTRFEIVYPDSHVNGLLVCSPEDNLDALEETARTWDSYYAQFKNALSNSEDINARVMAVNVVSDFVVPNRIEELADLIVQNPDHRLANLHFLNACAQMSENSLCSDNNVVQANRVNRGNAISWALLAVYRAAKEDDFGVDLAMSQAAIAPDFDDHFGMQLSVLRAAMPSGTELEQTSLLLNFMGRSDVIVFNNGFRVSYLCNAAGPLRSGLQESCLSYGERMQQEGSTTIMTSIGRSIREGTYRAMGNDVEANRLAQEYESYSRNLSSPESAWGQFNTITALMAFDLELAMFWNDNLIEFGEEPAVLNTLAEAKRRSANSDYAPCNSPGPKIHPRQQ